MLLKAKNRTIKRETALELWRVGGEGKIVKRPFDPYFYLPGEVKTVFGNRQYVEKIRLSTLEPEQMWKIGFKNTYDLRNSRSSFSIEADVNYDRRGPSVDCWYDTLLGCRYFSMIEPLNDRFLRYLCVDISDKFALNFHI